MNKSRTSWKRNIRIYRGDAFSCCTCVHEDSQFYSVPVMLVRHIYIYIRFIYTIYKPQQRTKCILWFGKFQGVIYVGVMMSGWNFVHADRFLVHIKMEHPPSEISCHTAIKLSRNVVYCHFLHNIAVSVRNSHVIFLVRWWNRTIQFTINTLKQSKEN